MNVVSRIPGKHLAVPSKDKDGRDFISVIVKYTYRVSAHGVVERDEDGRAPLPIDEPNGEDPAASSIKRPSDLFEWKPGTDVILIASAQPLGAATAVDVVLEMGSIKKTIRAHGLRVWQKSVLGGITAGPARPVTQPIPIVYELAWGGLDLGDPQKPFGEPRNYAGRGVAKNAASLIGQIAAQLEYPNRPVGSRDCAPASFGPIHRHWQPRAKFAGTYDRAWEEARMPLLPRDFDLRFNVCVPDDQHVDVPLRGDEPIAVLGATTSGPWRFGLPRDAPRFSSIVEREKRHHETHLDTVVIDANERLVELTWRAKIPYRGKLESIAEIRIEKDGARA